MSDCKGCTGCSAKPKAEAVVEAKGFQPLSDTGSLASKLGCSTWLFLIAIAVMFFLVGNIFPISNMISSKPEAKKVQASGLEVEEAEFTAASVPTAGLTVENYEKIQRSFTKGISYDEVLALLGPPDIIITGYASENRKLTYVQWGAETPKARVLFRDSKAVMLTCWKQRLNPQK